MKRLRGIIKRVIRREGRVGRVRPTSRAVRLRPTRDHGTAAVCTNTLQGHWVNTHHITRKKER